MEITTAMIKELREKSGAGIMDCRGALVSCDGDINKALVELKEKGLIKAQKKAMIIPIQVMPPNSGTMTKAKYPPSINSSP